MLMNKLIEALDTNGYYIWDDFLSAEQVEDLKACMPDEWKKACIGRNDEVMRESSIRSDKIHWLAESQGAALMISFLVWKRFVVLQINIST